MHSFPSRQRVASLISKALYIQGWKSPGKSKQDSIRAADSESKKTFMSPYVTVGVGGLFTSKSVTRATPGRTGPGVYAAAWGGPSVSMEHGGLLLRKRRPSDPENIADNHRPERKAARSPAGSYQHLSLYRKGKHTPI